MNDESYLQTEIKWPVLLPNNSSLSINDFLLESEEKKYLIKYDESTQEKLLSPIEKEDNIEIIQDDDYKVILLDLLQDLYYVTHLQNKDQTSYNKERLDYCDECWDALRVYWMCLLKLMKEQKEFLYRQENSEERDILFKKKGCGYSKFIAKMGGPYATRYLVYRIIQPLFQAKRKSKMTLGYCTDIVCNHTDFLKFWYNGIDQFAFILEEIQKEDKVNRLRNILKKLTAGKEYKKFQDKYTSEKGSCFMLANLTYAQSNKTILCFSGLFYKGPIKIAIKKIMQSNYFKNAYLVQVSKNIRYYLPTGQYITYGEAEEKREKCGIEYNSRMFSCCERKTFAAISWENCQSYEMIVKYSPCELCQKQVKDFEQEYNGRTIWGKECQSLGDKKDTFDSIAMEIYKHR